MQHGLEEEKVGRLAREVQVLKANEQVYKERIQELQDEVESERDAKEDLLETLQNKEQQLQQFQRTQHEDGHTSNRMSLQLQASALLLPWAQFKLI